MLDVIVMPEHVDYCEKYGKGDQYPEPAVGTRPQRGAAVSTMVPVVLAVVHVVVMVNVVTSVPVIMCMVWRRCRGLLCEIGGLRH